MATVQLSRYLEAWANKVLAYWLRPVIELPETSEPDRPRGQPLHAYVRFRVLTPEMQRQIDQSA